MVTVFLSTPSARRATRLTLPWFRGYNISIHALREEGDRFLEFWKAYPKKISIHALREEGDLRDRRQRERRPISIHALREEGDR